MNNINTNRRDTMHCVSTAPTFTAIIFALTLTLSCSSDDGDDDNTTGGTSSGLEEGLSSSSSGGNSSSGVPESSSSGKNPSSSSVSKTNVFVDSRDSKEYKIVKIGTQTWMAENLNWETGESWCYDNKNSNCEKYGRLYTLASAKTACPEGWHLPTMAEWDVLTAYVGGSDFAGEKLKSAMPLWDGTNDFDFSALPGGQRYTTGAFEDIDSKGNWWLDAGGKFRYMLSNYDGMGDNGTGNSLLGKSVRCVNDNLNELPISGSSSSELSLGSVESSSSLGCTEKDNDETNYCSNGVMKEYGIVTDADGQTYKTVVIGTQTWMAENLNVAPSAGNDVTTNSWCYDDEPANCEKYGRLYDWTTAMSLPEKCNHIPSDSEEDADCKTSYPRQGICPIDWHLPSNDEWNTLKDYIESQQDCISCTGSHLIVRNASHYGFNSYGFSALHGGYRHQYVDGIAYNDIALVDYWWSYTEDSAMYAYEWKVGYYGGDMREYYTKKIHGHSVRCIKD